MVNESENKETNAVAGLLGSLPRVNAPNDFDFRVKARIAAGQPTRVSWFPTVVRVAVPLGLVLSVGGYFGYQSVHHVVTPETAVVANTGSNVVTPPARNIAVAIASPVVSQSSNDITGDKMSVKAPVGEDKIIAGAKTGSPRPIDNEPGLPASGRNPRGGSFDIGQSESRKVFPMGVDPRRKILVRPHEFEDPAPIPAKDVIAQFGAEVVYSESGWRVAGVKENSPAQHAGLKSGDVIEAINEQKVTDKTTFRGPFAARTFRLKRDGASVTVDLNKKP